MQVITRYTHCIHNTYAVIMFPVDAKCSVHLVYIIRTRYVTHSSPLSPILCVSILITLNTYFYPALNHNNN